MSTLVLYIATSLDGFIARRNGDIDWLPVDVDYGYEAFYDSIDITLMGANTYRQVLTFGDFPYKAKTNYVFTRTLHKSTAEYVEFIQEDIAAFTKRLKDENRNKNIWLIGGNQVVGPLLKAELIDEFMIYVCPVILGEGIPLFTSPVPQQNLNLIKERTFENGIVEMHYKK